ncbi:DUF1822 family protein [Romeria aff. gracilis LEGE 07310]|uniref:DUF1822 family protein n=1 Tax=Vasconcelosia minhoensis LEGE 07310 TaxID=915328 RepID=A0A8J7ALZ1_9CYAN|nr:DUF1822 family protein [Romeria gracilis]MBE9080413.1 DUF1822 family protein [Romeria aff. gracilis LEGE 07310]
MTHSATDPNSFDDFAPLTEETIMLSNSAIDWAAGVCRDISDDDEQWKTYLRAFAVAGFNQWLKEGALSLVGDYERQQPPEIGVNMQVGGQRLCILPMGSLSEDQVIVPVSAIAGDRAADLYVLIEVQEEADRVRIVAGLRRDQLLRHHQNGDLLQINTQRISVPLRLFEETPEQLLLYLSCLEPVTETLSAAAATADRDNPVALDALSAGVINTSRWFKNQLDDISSRLAWTLLPPMVPATAMRPVRDTVDNIVQELTSHNIALPPEAKGVGGSIEVGGIPCQFYAWVWPLETQEVVEWSLLLMLGPEPGATLPAGTELIIDDQSEVIARQTFTEEDVATYLFTQVAGTIEEQFSVQICLPTGEITKLPTFGF